MTERLFNVSFMSVTLKDGMVREQRTMTAAQLSSWLKSVGLETDGFDIRKVVEVCRLNGSGSVGMVFTKPLSLKISPAS